MAALCRARRLRAALFLIGVPWVGMAQLPPRNGMMGQSEESVRSLHLAERNQLGLLEYCQAQGAIAEEVVAMQRAMVDLLPPVSVAGLEEAEAVGRRGIVAFELSAVPIAQAAMGEGITVVSRCKQMALVVEARAGQKLTW